ncbi:hypothetical protein UlMin_017003 [Ulmus minor]
MEINLEKLAFDLDFHPLENLVSAALVNGDLLIYRYSSDSTPQKVSEVHAHTESCRAIRFIDDGREIVMGLLDHLILATYVETGGTIAHLEDTHGEAINKIINLHQSKIASRDDGGCIKVWDIRQRSCCGTCQAHEDYVSDMTFVPDAMKLLGTSGDETLSVCNLRKETIWFLTLLLHSFQARSEFSEEEFFSVVLLKTYCVLACFSVAGLITYLFVGWNCWIIFRMYAGCFFLVDAGLNSIYITIYGLIVGFTVHLLDKTCVLTGFSLAVLLHDRLNLQLYFLGHQQPENQQKETEQDNLDTEVVPTKFNPTLNLKAKNSSWVLGKP